MRKKLPEIKPFQYRLKIDRPRKEQSNKEQLKQGRNDQLAEKDKIQPNNGNNSSKLLQLQNSNLQVQPKSHNHISSPKNMLEKQNKPKRSSTILHHEQNQQKKKDHRVKTYNARKKSLSQKKQSGIQKNQANPYKQFSSQLIQTLQKKYVITVKSDIISIKKDSFIDFVSSLMESLIEGGHCELKKNQGWLNEVLKEISEFGHKKKIINMGKKLQLHSKLVQRVINPYYIRRELEQETLKMSSLLQQQTKLDDQVKVLSEKQKALGQICEEKKAQTVEWERRVYEAKQTIEKNIQQIKQLEFQKDKGQKELDKINEEEQRIKNYVLTQTDIPLMQYVGQQFQKLENEMIDYAAYMHWDPPSSSLTYQPKPFSVVEKYMREDLKSTLYFIRRDDKTAEEKSKVMVEFVEDCFHKFVVKDEEMVKLNLIKTENARKFIDMMHRWMDSSEIKRETLLDLRKEFVVDAEGITSILISLLSQPKSQEQVHKDLTLLQKHWKKVEKNYKMGNFFY